jgi:hypothetical protein
MHNPIEMVALRNPLDPGRGPAPDRSADNPGDPARQDDGGDLDEIRKDEDFIEQVPFEVLEVGRHVLPDRKRFDFYLPSLDGSVAKSPPRMTKRTQEFNVKLSARALICRAEGHRSPECSRSDHAEGQRTP